MPKPADCITTYTGRILAPAHPAIEDIEIRDIAHALSLLCRAGGHFAQFFSVAQHSLHCAAEAAARGHSRRVQLACLLHDGSEAYLADITRPVKQGLTGYRDLEAALQGLIYQKYLGSPPTPEEATQVSAVDDTMLYCEFLHFMGEALAVDAQPMLTAPAYGFRPFAEVEQAFLELFSELTAD